MVSLGHGEKGELHRHLFRIPFSIVKSTVSDWTEDSTAGQVSWRKGFDHFRPSTRSTCRSMFERNSWGEKLAHKTPASRPYNIETMHRADAIWKPAYPGSSLQAKSQKETRGERKRGREGVDLSSPPSPSGSIRISGNPSGPASRLPPVPAPKEPLPVSRTDEAPAPCKPWTAPLTDRSLDPGVAVLQQAPPPPRCPEKVSHLHHRHQENHKLSIPPNRAISIPP